MAADVEPRLAGSYHLELVLQDKKDQKVYTEGFFSGGSSDA